MAQTYNDAVPASTRNALEDLTAIRNNFAALKSSFSGATAPPNPVAGMWWYDTTANILKLRNEANNAWLDVYDFANGCATKCSRSVSAGTGLSGGGTLTTDRTISHVAHTGDVTGATTLSIAADVVKMSNMQHGSIMLPVFTATALDINKTSWTQISPTYRVYIPADATSIQLSVQISGGTSGGSHYIRLVVGSLTSSTVTHTGIAAAWSTLNLSVDSISGWQTMYIEGYYGGGPGYVNSFGVAWM